MAFNATDSDLMALMSLRCKRPRKPENLPNHSDHFCFLIYIKIGESLLKKQKEWGQGGLWGRVGEEENFTFPFYTLLYFSKNFTGICLCIASINI